MTSMWVKLPVKLMVGFCTIQFCLSSSSGSISNPSTSVNPTSKNTIFTQIIHRHGARTPTLIYDNDPNKDFPEWRALGPQQLTNTGKNQLLEFGKSLRSRYSQLISESYNRNDIYVRSTDTDRTIMSAQCELAGLYPPKGDQVWNQDFTNWQPIPVHTRFPLDDYLNGKPCPKYDYEYKKLLESDEFQEFGKRYQKLSDFLSEKLNYTIKTLADLERANDLFTIELENNLKWPEWLTPEIYHELNEVALISLRSQSWNDELKRFKAGVFLYEMVDHFVSKSEAKLVYNAWIFSSHDITMLNIMQTLNIFENRLIPAAGALMFDLQKSNNGQLGVAIYYRNSTTVEPTLMKLPKCDDICELSKFIEILKPFTLAPEQWDKECMMS